MDQQSLQTLPNGWTVKTLDEVALWSSGGTPSRKNPKYFKGSIPWVKTGELGPMYLKSAEEHITMEAIQKSSAKVFPGGSVGIAMYGATIGKLSIWAADLSVNQACAVAQPYKEIIISEFLYYFLLSQKQALMKIGKGGAQPNISQSILKSWPVYLPPTNEQRRIVAKIEELFSELDKGVESLKKARAQFNIYRQAVLKHAFEGKLTAKWREENKDKLEKPEQLLARIQQERAAQYEKKLKEWKTAVKTWETKDKQGKKPTKPQKLGEPKRILPCDELPILPGGWAWLRFGDLCSLVRNGISKKPEGDSGEKIFRISAVRPMEFDLNDVRFIADDSDQFSNYYLQTGDLVFTRYNGSRAYVGVCAEYKSDGSHLYPDKLIRTQLCTSQTLPGYIEKAVNCGVSRDFIESKIRTTAGQSGISGSDIKSMPIPLCNPTEQRIIQDKMDKVLARVSQLIANIEQNLDRVGFLRQSILKKAFAGQLVTQDPDDEPAFLLLDRIKTEKEREFKGHENSKKIKGKRTAA